MLIFGFETLRLVGPGRNCLAFDPLLLATPIAEARLEVPGLGLGDRLLWSAQFAQSFSSGRRFPGHVINAVLSRSQPFDPKHLHCVFNRVTTSVSKHNLEACLPWIGNELFK